MTGNDASGTEALSPAPPEAVGRSRDLILPWESRKEFEALRCGLMQQYEPQGALEWLLVEQVARSSWRLKRFHTIESGLLTHESLRIARRQAKSRGAVLEVPFALTGFTDSATQDPEDEPPENLNVRVIYQDPDGTISSPDEEERPKPKFIYEPTGVDQALAFARSAGRHSWARLQKYQKSIENRICRFTAELKTRRASQENGPTMLYLNPSLIENELESRGGLAGLCQRSTAEGELRPSDFCRKERTPSDCLPKSPTNGASLPERNIKKLNRDDESWPEKRNPDGSHSDSPTGPGQSRVPETESQCRADGEQDLPGSNSSAPGSETPFSFALRDGSGDAGTAVLPWESREDFEAVLSGLIQECRPQYRNESLLAGQIASAVWRLYRCDAIETGLLVCQILKIARNRARCNNAELELRPDLSGFFECDDEDAPQIPRTITVRFLRPGEPPPPDEWSGDKLPTGKYVYKATVVDQALAFLNGSTRDFVSNSKPARPTRFSKRPADADSWGRLQEYRRGFEDSLCRAVRELQRLRVARCKSCEPPKIVLALIDRELERRRGTDQSRDVWLGWALTSARKAGGSR